MFKEIDIASHDDVTIKVKLWDEVVGQVKGIVQVSHGMAERISRYNEFAVFLNDNGYVVIGHDHRGHGDTATSVSLGFFSNNSGWSKVINDLHKVATKAKALYPDIPHYIFGHSMGSFITRDYIRLHSKELSGVIISGTGHQKLSLIKTASLIAKVEMKFKGPMHKSTLLNSMSFGSFNKTFRPNRTEFDWLSRDSDKVDEYVQDEKCGFICTTSMFIDLFKGLKSLTNLDTLANCDKNLPIMFISGEDDPVGDFSQGVNKVYNQYKRIGFDDLSLNIYPKCRHELLNETNRLDIYFDIMKWLNNHTL